MHPSSKSLGTPNVRLRTHSLWHVIPRHQEFTYISSQEMQGYKITKESRLWGSFQPFHPCSYVRYVVIVTCMILSPTWLTNSSVAFRSLSLWSASQLSPSSKHPGYLRGSRWRSGNKLQTTENKQTSTQQCKRGCIIGYRRLCLQDSNTQPFQHQKLR